MRIDQIEISNFKKFKSLKVDLHPGFNLLIGDNGSGKTTILDALAVAIGIWGKKVSGSVRNILNEEVKLEQLKFGDRAIFEPLLPTSITAYGSIGEEKGLSWTRRIRV